MVAFEFDLLEYYHRDLRDLWKRDSGVTVRWVISAFEQLPYDSRVKKTLAGDIAEWGWQEHLLADIRDLLAQDVYFNHVNCMAQLRSSDRKKIMKDAPKPFGRPGDEQRKEMEPQEEQKFATDDDLMALFGSRGIGKPRGRYK